MSFRRWSPKLGAKPTIAGSLLFERTVWRGGTLATIRPYLPWSSVTIKGLSISSLTHKHPQPATSARHHLMRTARWLPCQRPTALLSGHALGRATGGPSTAALVFPSAHNSSHQVRPPPLHFPIICCVAKRSSSPSWLSLYATDMWGLVLVRVQKRHTSIHRVRQGEQLSFALITPKRHVPPVFSSLLFLLVQLTSSVVCRWVVCRVSCRAVWPRA